MGMLYSILICATMQFFMLAVRRKNYDVSMEKVCVINIVVTIFTTLGACIGSFLGGMSFLGLRLYGIIMILTIAMFWLSKIFKMEVGHIGDYLSVPIIAVCCIGKVLCWLDDCCYGRELFISAAGNVVRFPSQVVELFIWAILTVWLCVVEYKGKHKNFLWAIATIWFGIFRFLVDFMRGNPSEMKLVILRLPAGRFWSLFVVIMGVTFMIWSFRKYCGYNPSMMKMLRTIFGLKTN